STARPITEVRNGASKSSGKSVTTSTWRRGASAISDLLRLVAHDHPTRREVDRAHDLAQRGDEQLPRAPFDAVDLVLAGTADLDHVPKLGPLLVDRGQPDQLVPVVGPRRQRGQRRLQVAAGKLLGGRAVADSLEEQHRDAPAPGDIQDPAG